ncbi:MAG: type II toxin-antitoxin system VapC family toxin [Campylobacterota bacterium]|nr:type II toxin-antitoxin system VapC family toxin [Campylobacterota bacterium]
MKDIMLDTNICIYIIKNKPQAVIQKFQEYNVGDISLSTITVSELYYGAYKSEYIEKNLLALEHFLQPFNIIEYDLKASIEYGQIRATLEKQGNIIGGLDMQIAAHARSLDMTLITNNTKEFIRVENLVIDNWV